MTKPNTDTHPDDARADAVPILATWLDDDSRATYDLLNAQAVAGEGSPLQVTDERESIEFDGYSLVPYRSRVQRGRTLRTLTCGCGVLGIDRRCNTCYRDAIGWTAYGTTGSYSYQDGWDYDEVIVAQVEEGLAKLITEIRLWELEQQLGEATLSGNDCPACQGTGCLDPLEDPRDDCPQCHGTGLSDDARATLARIKNT